ncbi:hypothetical protein ACQ4PT_002022 [Festuca glaucescens]
MGINDILHTVYSCLPETPLPGAPSLSATISSYTSSSGEESSSGEDRVSALPDDLLRNIANLIRAADLRDGSGLVAFVSRVLTDHQGPFRWVHLSWNFLGNHQGELAQWLSLFADKGVETLILVNRPWPLDVLLPASILRCSSLRRLYLGVWRFPDTTGHPRGPDVFPHLQELGICHAILQEHDLEYLLACSPELKIFGLIQSYGFPSRVRISSNSVRCVLLWFSTAEELAVVTATRLQRLILYYTNPGRTSTTNVKIGYAPELTVLGYLDTASHVLEIGNTIITAGEKNVSPDAMVQSVKVLALMVCFSVASEVQTLLSFVRCFPHVETLHVMVERIRMPSIKEDVEEEYASDDELGSMFWEESHMTKVLLDQFRWGVNELGFLELVLRSAEMLESAVLVLDGGMSSEEVTQATRRLAWLQDSVKFASDECELTMFAPPRGSWSYHRASDLSLSDPFPSRHDARDARDGERVARASTIFGPSLKNLRER